MYLVVIWKKRVNFWRLLSHPGSYLTLHLLFELIRNFKLVSNMAMMLFK
jgi:hypothetical protein